MLDYAYTGEEYTHPAVLFGVENAHDRGPVYEECQCISRVAVFNLTTSAEYSRALDERVESPHIRVKPKARRGGYAVL